MIFNIQRFSTHDGQGIRTMIFYKGCPLRCQWCCNPESQDFGPSLMYDEKLCKNFRDCVEPKNSFITANENGITIDRSSVNQVEELKNICATKALTVSGEEKSVSDILFEIEKDKPFYRQNGGGVTLSGGEPLAQGPELEALLIELKKLKMDVSIETSLHVSWPKIERCLYLTSTFLVDLKHTDSEKFNRFTGGDANLVLANIRKLASCNENIIIRVPVIPEFNDTEPEMKKIIEFVSSLKTIREIHFLPFHNMGSAKYKMLGMEYRYSGKTHIEAGLLTEYTEYAESFGLIAKIGG
jgi:pyruvate formate lyase activating enzyme